MNINNKSILAALILITALGIPTVTTFSAPPASDDRNFAAHLLGNEEVPPVDTLAQGRATFRLNEDGTELSYRLNVSNIEDVSMAHIHLGAAGMNGPVVAWLYPGEPQPAVIPGRFDGVLAEGTITADNLVGPLEGQSLKALMDVMRAGETYANVHTEQNPEGEVRGQIRTETAIPEFPPGILLPIAGIMGIVALLYRREK
ncbi:CHRD domain-containing protein [Candidatus Methanoperedens nitroreducens]|uniref:CHRD domain-containing protein n=1 Tax=Candidatus Methanoperedens nitratireducens TaxID=1392998 RepID=A0A062V1A7_9EURY|nr:CHRD domain-containing protein [Candidatus Methanoperedens nitroreducens]KCZ70398.1 CHRD domain-containing protein [Candidatus Methanoperedens nitroreducens]MDJ1420836.1 CHRD domain-containing protein [Candidatus Methanoperedens sp.]